MREVVIVEPVRAPIGKGNGLLTTMLPVHLAARVLRALIDRAQIDPALIEDVIFGCVTPLGEQGASIAYVTPEAQEGGPIALLENGDLVTIDAERNLLGVALDEAEIARRRAAWTAPPYKAARGTLYRYIKTVKSASEGCVTDE